MATKTTHHCDRCDMQLSYTDADGDTHVAGIKVQGSLEFNIHERKTTGYSSYPVGDLEGGLFCSSTCLLAHIDESLDDLRRFRNGIDT